MEMQHKCGVLLVSVLLLCTTSPKCSVSAAGVGPVDLTIGVVRLDNGSLAFGTVDFTRNRINRDTTTPI